ncbi:restriction endonuclease subunit S [Pseudomonas sp. S12(2018)]|uniref:restriction endonuclease subunit S n=1 Tax=Pseudomonas sp. S12(2018) TaxID=2219664 RepID=UPI0020CDE6B0|nr:restriction endonuclease subunit S [Pseudomonas sp. S12(2018)]MCQ0169085.1 restriction endonuclease subunit S [Pseudomonas sp. S12(2018)]
MKAPLGWTHTTFDKHVDCLTGFAFKSSDYSSDEKDVRLLRGDNIEPGNLRWKDAKFWPDTELDSFERYRLQEGDFVIALDRTWISSGLKVAEVTPADLPCLLVQRVARVRANSTLEQSLLRQYFSGHRFEQYVKSVQTATAVPHISPNDIKEFPVALPPLSEQKKITKILSTWDKAITTTEQLLANSQQQKKALMQQLLTGKKRLLDKNGVRFSGEWKRVELGDLLDYRQPTPYLVESTNYSDAFSTPVLTAGKTFILGYTNEDSGIFAENLPVIIFDDFTTDSKFVEFPFKAKSSAMKILTARHGVSIRYVYEAMQLLDFAVGGHQRHWISIYSRLVVPFPEKDEQKKIAEVLSTADSEITNLQQKLDALKQEKKALMQQLLTGKRRVKVDDQEVA